MPRFKGWSYPLLVSWSLQQSLGESGLKKIPYFYRTKRSRNFAGDRRCLHQNIKDSEDFIGMFYLVNRRSLHECWVKAWRGLSPVDRGRWTDGGQSQRVGRSPISGNVRERR